MQLDESYEILEFTQHEGVVISKARDKRTGKLIQIHLFPNEKIPEASQICARLLSLPSEARSKVLKYGRDGNSTFFITEMLPEGEGLGEWVLRKAAVLPPVLSDGAVGHLRRMAIDPAPLQPLAPGPESRPIPAEQAPSLSLAPPSAQPVPRVRPMRQATGSPDPVARGEGEFTLLYTREEVKTPVEFSPAPLTTPSPAVSQAPLNVTSQFKQIYGEQAITTPEQQSFPGTAPESRGATSETGSGLETFIGIPKTTRPPALPPRGFALESTASASPPPIEAKPLPQAPPAQSLDRIFPTPRVVRPAGETLTFDAPVPQSHVREPAEMFALPPSSPPSPSATQSPVRQPATIPETRRAPAPLFSGRVAAVAALGLIAVAAIVALIVEVSG
jgi:hypothetical protein